MDFSNIGTAVMVLITGFLMPFVTGYFSRSTWADWLKFVFVGLFAAVVGSLQLFFAGSFEGLTWADWGGYVGMIYAASAVFFWLLVNNIPSLKSWLANHGWKPKV
jgi:hypothetical protein